MRQTGTGEDRKFLSADKSVQSVNGRYACLDKLFRVYAAAVHRQTIDISSFIRQDFRAVVNRTSQTVEYTSQHIA